ncbi:MAG: CCA tRNA nucleotidyltransferase [Clostridia bacterium]|nr:CCA tRNA nucleotidyltransferase [Clostridia bacterium]
MIRKLGASRSISIPAAPLSIIDTLNQNGYEAYVVGGCVRDSILGVKPKDWDIATSAKPDEIKKVFNKTIDTGIQHGTVTVVIKGENFEVTTYRVDGEYADSRRPKSVSFTSSLKDDLSRRDFTVNAIAYHPEKGFADPFNGMEDIKECVIRCVGDAGERFREDALRMLRAIRFSAQLNFSIDALTHKAIEDHNGLIRNISQERIREELTKLLLSEYPERFLLLYRTYLLKHILPEFEPCFLTKQNNPYHIYSVAEHTIKAVASIRQTPVLRWTMLLHDLGKPLTKTTDEKGIDHFYGHPDKSFHIAQKILYRLRFDKKTIDKVCRLVKLHDRPIELTCNAVRKAVYSVGDDIFPELLEVKEADYKAQNPDFLIKRLEKISIIRSMYNNIKQENQCFSLNNLAVNGNILKQEGFKEGKEIGNILKRLLDAVIDDPELNEKEKLLELVRRMPRQ